VNTPGRRHETADRRGNRSRRGGSGRWPADRGHVGVHQTGRERGYPSGEPVQRGAREPQPG